jgi:Flp pilus assembly protein TadG
MKKKSKGGPSNARALGVSPLRFSNPASESGQTLVEFALVLPLLVLFAIGAVEMGRLVYMSIGVSNAAHAGAQYGCQNGAHAGDVAGMQTAAAADAPDLVGATNGNLTTTPTSYCQCSDGSSANSSCTTNPPACTGTHLVQFVSVSTTATYTPWFPYPGIPSSVALHGSAVMQVGQ